MQPHLQAVQIWLVYVGIEQLTVSSRGVFTQRPAAAPCSHFEVMVGGQRYNETRRFCALIHTCFSCIRDVNGRLMCSHRGPLLIGWEWGLEQSSPRVCRSVQSSSPLHWLRFNTSNRAFLPNRTSRSGSRHRFHVSTIMSRLDGGRFVVSSWEPRGV